LRFEVSLCRIGRRLALGFSREVVRDFPAGLEEHEVGQSLTLNGRPGGRRRASSILVWRTPA
jgi:hypothetical protein